MYCVCHCLIPARRSKASPTGLCHVLQMSNKLWIFPCLGRCDEPLFKPCLFCLQEMMWNISHITTSAMAENRRNSRQEHGAHSRDNTGTEGTQEERPNTRTSQQRRQDSMQPSLRQQVSRQNSRQQLGQVSRQQSVVGNGSRVLSYVSEEGGNGRASRNIPTPDDDDDFGVRVSVFSPTPEERRFMDYTGTRNPKMAIGHEFIGKRTVNPSRSPGWGNGFSPGPHRSFPPTHTPLEPPRTAVMHGGYPGGGLYLADGDSMPDARAVEQRRKLKRRQTLRRDRWRFTVLDVSNFLFHNQTWNRACPVLNTFVQTSQTKTDLPVCYFVHQFQEVATVLQMAAIVNAG